jgi:hypothetical protein
MPIFSLDYFYVLYSGNMRKFIVRFSFLYTHSYYTKKYKRVIWAWQKEERKEGKKDESLSQLLHLLTLWSNYIAPITKTCKISLCVHAWVVGASSKLRSICSSVKKRKGSHRSGQDLEGSTEPFPIQCCVLPKEAEVSELNDTPGQRRNINP